MVTPEELAAFRAGDANGVRAVYREYGRLVFTVAHRTLASRDLAEEATQQTFFKAWQSAAGFWPARDLGTFNEPDDVVLWAGVSPREFPTITVTREAADGDPSSSGELVLTGTITER